MVDVITGLYDFTLPEVGGSDDTWGDKLNSNWLKMETLLAGAFPLGTPATLGGVLDLRQSSPQLRWTETDQTQPAGRFRMSSLNNALYIDRSTSTPDDWTTATTIAQFDMEGTGASDPQTIITREKGDARYLNLTAGVTNALTGELFTKGATAIRVKSAVGVAGYGTLIYSDANTFYIMLTASGDADGTFSALRPFSITKATGNVGMSENLIVSGYSRGGSIYVGASPTGGANPTNVSAVTGSPLTLRGGIDTNGMVTFGNATGTTVAALAPGGTAVVAGSTVITVEKGDFRYAPKALLLTALQALADSAPVAELRDVLIAALISPIPDDPPLEVIP